MIIIIVAEFFTLLRKGRTSIESINQAREGQGHKADKSESYIRVGEYDSEMNNLSLLALLALLYTLLACLRRLCCVVPAVLHT